MGHDRPMRRLLAVVLTLTAAAGLGTSLPAAAAGGPTGPSTLTVGHSLHALAPDASLTSPSGNFTLSVVPFIAEIDQLIRVGDVPTVVEAPTWSTPWRDGGNDHSELVLQ